MTRRKLTKARAEADELRRQLAEMQAALENLTPGGSEFAGSFAVCLNWIRTRLATTGHVAAERNELRRQLAEAQARQVAAMSECDSLRGLLTACREAMGAADNAQLLEMCEDTGSRTRE